MKYCIKDDIEALRNNPEGTEAQVHRRRIAANVGDPAVLRRLFGLDPEEFGSFYPDMSTSTPSTLDTISGFLSRYSRGSGEVRVESGEVSNLKPQLSTPKEVSTLNSQLSTPEQLSIPELIRSGLYEAALQRIIENNLNNPEKSIYFADQTRFLRKLIAIQKMKVGG